MTCDSACAPMFTAPIFASISLKWSSFAWNASRAACCAARTSSLRLRILAASVTPGTETRNLSRNSVSIRAVPLVSILRIDDQFVGELGDGLLDHPQRLCLELLAPLEREQAQRVDDFPLLVHHIVVFEELLPRLEVLELDALLGLPDGRGHPGVGNDLVFLGARAVHDACDAI